jgi:RNA polymerase sigma-70 factor (ECF subfamily)
MRISESELLTSLPRLRRFARSLSIDSSEAEALLKESLERAVAREKSWTGENLQAWLMGLMSEVYRARGRRERGTAEAEEAGGADPAARRRLAVAVDRLSPENRAVMMLVVVEGFSYPEVAQILDLPLNMVMSRLYRARAALADTLRSHNVVAFTRRK